MLMFLANIGEVLASSIRFLYGRGCCLFCTKKRKIWHQPKPQDNVDLVENPDLKPGDDEEDEVWKKKCEFEGGK